MLSCLSRKRNRGFFLIEVVVAVGVMAIGLTTVMQVYAYQTKIAVMSERSMESTFLVSDHLGAVMAGVDAGPLYAQAGRLDDQEDIRIDERSLDGPKKGLKEKTVSVVGHQDRQRRAVILTYIRNENAPL